MPASSFLSKEHPRKILGSNASETVNGFTNTEISWMVSSQMIAFSAVSLIYCILMKNISPRSQIQILGFFRVIHWGILLFGNITVNDFFHSFLNTNNY